MSGMATAHLNIGSNIGDRHALIGQAVAAVERAFDAKALCSEPIENPPQGFNSPNRFLNLGLNIDVGDRNPPEVLELIQRAEKSVDGSAHRNGDGSYIDRRIDIDLIAIDDLVINSPRLTLPHPRMHTRDFVLRPMNAIWPDWRHPVFHATPQTMLDRLEKSGAK